jgi:hypothetical protein
MLPRDIAPSCMTGASSSITKCCVEPSMDAVQYLATAASRTAEDAPMQNTSAVRSLLVLALATPSLALAQVRASTTAMTCAAAQTTVARAGAIVLGSGGSTYDRFVIAESYCTRDELTEPAFAPTTDNPQCLVGYRCREKPSETKT